MASITSAKSHDLPGALRRFGWARLLTHVALAAGTLYGCWLTAGYLHAPLLSNHSLTISLGYVALVLIGISLVIGPLNLLRRKRNPVNIDLRRDVGIWSGITGCLHVFYGLDLNLNTGWQWVYFFISPDTGSGWQLQLNIFGVSNYVGLGATVLLILLTVLSNDLSLRKLKGPRWKRIQQTTYLLTLLALAHTFGYQILTHRPNGFFWLTLLLTVVVLGLQLVGMGLHNWREQGREERRLALRGK